MKKTVPFFVFTVVCALGGEEVDPLPVGVPDALVALDGTRIHTPAQWESKRRPEILELFQSQLYGRPPFDHPHKQWTEIVEAEHNAFNGACLGRRLAIKHSGPGGEGMIGVALYTPPKSITPKGCFVLIVNRKGLIVEDAGSNPTGFWPVLDIVARGYVAVAFHNDDIAPDSKDDGFQSGVFRIYGPAPSARTPESWATISAWAWGTRCVIDYLKSNPEFAQLPLAVIGHSRGGKAALWCGAQDQRIDLTIANESGCAGAALARTTTGETVKRLNDKFPHWMAGSYKQYNGKEGNLPVDQHLLIALMAPRLVYVASASEDHVSDPKAEFAGWANARSVFQLLGKSGTAIAAQPAAGFSVVSGVMGYHLRTGKHDLTTYDWKMFLDFADRQWAFSQSSLR